MSDGTQHAAMEASATSPRSDVATIYFWGDDGVFDVGAILHVLGGQTTPSLSELASHRMTKPVLFTPEFVVYPVSRKQNAEFEQRTARFGAGPIERELWPAFATCDLANRASEMDLETPDYEIVVGVRNETMNGIDGETIAAAAAYLDFECAMRDAKGYHQVLAVIGTDLESATEKPLYASKALAEQLADQTRN